jgi:hypothetical protein
MIEGLRIYADFNGLDQSPRDATRTAVPLDTFGSLRDLSNAGVRLREGVRMVIYADSDELEDLEADAEAYYEPNRRLWFAEINSGIRYVARPEAQDVGNFLCVDCRSPLPVEKSARPDVSTCPTCGTPVDAAIEPPKSEGTTAVT